MRHKASGHGIDVEALFTDIENYKNNIKTVNVLIEAFNKNYRKNLDELNSNNKCEVRYTATPNPKYKPFNTAFETIQVYDVKVLVEYKSGVINAVFHSQGRKKDSACQRMIFNRNKFVGIYEEEEAIYMIKAYVEKYIADCDTDEKFNAFQRSLQRSRRN